MSDGKPADERKAARVVFHYIKSSGFRTVYVDGAIGSVTPAGNVHCAIYSERPAIPRTTYHDLDEQHRIVDEGTVVDSRNGIVREMQADLVMSKETAQSLALWLSAILKSDNAMPNEEGTLQ